MNSDKVNKLRNILKTHNIGGYIVPSTDEYMSEYTPEYAKRLEYITGFTGSNGVVVILSDEALFFTDGRYLEQSRQQLDPTIFKIFDQKNLLDFRWDDYIVNYAKIAFDPKLFTNSSLKNFSKLRLKSLNSNLIDEIWPNQPQRPNSKVYLHPDHLSGLNYKNKVKLCSQSLDKHSAIALVITATDSICWLLNIRAADVEFSPILLARMIVTKENIYLFTNISRVDDEIRQSRPEVTFLAEEHFTKIVKNIKGKILVDEDNASVFIMNLLKNQEIQKIVDPCKLPKACKNAIEIQCAIEAHISDGVALCEFLSSLKQNITEYELGIRLSSIRAQQKNYIMDSFPAICGFKENGAVIHYRASKETAKKIEANGMLLIDSGGQYQGATTDITRTICLGKPTEEQKKRYTQLLKGHIALSTIKFPLNTSGGNLDVLARQFLWQENEDYAHGTGHGVGSFLSVHEGPQSLNSRSNVVLKPGMILSNEPGYYKAGSYGIRIENLMYIKTGNKEGWLEFETLTLVPYAKELIDESLLEDNEKKYLHLYYKKIKNSIYQLLSNTAKQWLLENLVF